MAQQGDEDLHIEDTPGYKPPAEKSLTEIIKTDADDESLVKYKQALLGSGAGDNVIVFPDNPKRVIVQKLALVVEGRPDMELDLAGRSLDELKKKAFVMKEGTMYKVKIYFYVQREIVTGLKYVQSSYRKGIRVDKTNFMVGSYAPKADMQSYCTPPEEAPSGMIARGSYTVKSLFTDDDKNEHLKWEWSLDIKKDWEQ